MRTSNHVLLTTAIFIFLPLAGTANAEARRYLQNTKDAFVQNTKHSVVDSKRLVKPVSRPIKKMQRMIPPSTTPAHRNATNNFAGNMEGAGQANLVIELFNNKSYPEGFPNTGFCSPNGPSGGSSDRIRFRVRNEGSATAVASTTTVHWSSGAENLYTPAINPGSARNFYLDIPAACWPNTAHGTCDFLVELDRNNVVPESEENDNFDDGHCMLPGT